MLQSGLPGLATGVLWDILSFVVGQTRVPLPSTHWTPEPSPQWDKHRWVQALPKAEGHCSPGSEVCLVWK